MKDKKEEPVIVAFICNWCASAAADLAGTSRMQYAPNIRPIRVMCTGSIDTSYILKPFLDGADGVFIGGCHPGDCHYIDGNYKARRRVEEVKVILKSLGLDEWRIRLRWISASEGKKFADEVNSFVDELRNAGKRGKMP
jgi:F420-non-reducing hydrogenase iron-sulfur subunit